MSLFSELTNIYDCDLENIHGDEVYNFINRNKEKIEELDKNITTEFASKNKKINILTTENYKKAYQISKLKTEIIQKDQHIAELEEENKELKKINEDSVRKSVFNSLMKCADTFYNKKRELQKENAKTRKWLNDYGFKTLEEFDKYIEELCIDGKDLVRENDELSTENDNLKEQLKNAYCPKYKTGEEIWFIDPEKDISHGTILITEFDNGNIFYTILDVHDTDYTEYRREEEVFATKAEAQKYLEGIK